MSKLVSLLKLGDPPWETQDVQWTTPDGAYSITEVKTQWDFELETFYLAHCLGTKDAAEFNENHRVFSVRDRLGIPHATILLLRDGRRSPYGGSQDLLTNNTMKLPARPVEWGPGHGSVNRYKVLQVRGRKDNIARWEYYSIVRDWFNAHGGKFPNKHAKMNIQKGVLAIQDKDLKYHYGYLLDESVNVFTWAHWNGEYEEKFAKLGLIEVE